jgi:3-demethoxyubiquinol 3-hydroxylase
LSALKTASLEKCQNRIMHSFILSFDRAVRTLSGAARAQRASPAKNAVREVHATASMASTASNENTPHRDAVDKLSAADRDRSIALMRVNHAGEVAAQALYQGQALFSRDPVIREKLAHAADEELDHLAWTRERVHALGGRTSLLDPVWYAGAFAIGAAAGALGDRVSLGFLQATEEQVEAHLDSHLSKLPEHDLESRAIVEQMKRDEAGHAQAARDSGATALPLIAKKIMAFGAKIMITTTEKI